MDNVRNLTGSPIAGIDPHEHIDSRPLCKAIDDMITNCGAGNPELANLPRKFNIAVSTTRDDFPHCHINDLGLQVWRGVVWCGVVWGEGCMCGVLEGYGLGGHHGVMDMWYTPCVYVEAT